MSDPAVEDILLRAETRDRLNYALGVLLDASDFDAEQAYHRGRLARALAYLHGMGTAAGLKVEWAPPGATPEELRVAPGVAVDPFGRLVELPVKACLKVDRWWWQEGLALADFGVFAAADYHLSPGAAGAPDRGVVADLFLRFRACQREKTPAFATGPFDATDAVVPARTRDQYELRLVPRSVANPPPPVPPSPYPDPGEPDLPTRRAALRAAIFDAWRGTRDAELAALWASSFLPPSLLVDEEQPDRRVRDPAWILIARVVFAAAEGTDARVGLERPKRSGPVFVDNDLRPFALTAAALARWVGAP